MAPADPVRGNPRLGDVLLVARDHDNPVWRAAGARHLRAPHGRLRLPAPPRAGGAAAPGLLLGFRCTAPPLIFMLVYVWSRYNRNSSVSMYGVVSLQAFYVPWAILFIDILLGYDPLGDLCGVLAGHLYYHLVELYPRAGGKQLLSTPEWLKFALASAGVGHADPAYAQRANPGHKAWQGTGRRLGGR